jgi:hypothetical protein
MRRALFIPQFGELADPRLLADLAERAEGAGWDVVLVDEPAFSAQDWAQAGVTWLLTGFSQFEARAADIGKVADAGPGE